MLGSAWYKTPRRSRKTRKPSGRHYSAPPHTVHPRPAFHARADVLTCMHAYTGAHTPPRQHSPCFTCHTHSPHTSSHIQTHAFTQRCIYTHTRVHTPTLTQDTHVHRHIQTCARTPLNTRPTWPHHAVYSHTYLHPQTSSVHTHTQALHPHACMHACMCTHTPT